MSILPAPVQITSSTDWTHTSQVALIQNTQIQRRRVSSCFWSLNGHWHGSFLLSFSSIFVKEPKHFDRATWIGPFSFMWYQSDVNGEASGCAVSLLAPLSAVCAIGGQFPQYKNGGRTTNVNFLSSSSAVSIFVQDRVWLKSISLFNKCCWDHGPYESWEDLIWYWGQHMRIFNVRKSTYLINCRYSFNCKQKKACFPFWCTLGYNTHESQTVSL